MPIILTWRFGRAFRALNKQIQKKALRVLELLDRDMGHPSLRCKLVQGTPDIYEARVDLKYRMTFQLVGEVKVLRNIDNHDECLRNP
ncbi:MAG: hypothetical protein M1299_02950 [Firmicutes bacterium]|nr:hypothetical protein [Bacillota bacterium]